MVVIIHAYYFCHTQCGWSVVRTKLTKQNFEECNHYCYSQSWIKYIAHLNLFQYKHTFNTVKLILFTFWWVCGFLFWVWIKLGNWKEGKREKVWPCVSDITDSRQRNLYKSKIRICYTLGYKLQEPCQFSLSLTTSRHAYGYVMCCELSCWDKTMCGVLYCCLHTVQVSLNEYQHMSYSLLFHLSFIGYFNKVKFQASIEAV